MQGYNETISNVIDGDLSLHIKANIDLPDGCFVGNTFTVEAWIRPSNPETFGRIFYMGVDACPSRQLAFYWKNDVDRVEGYTQTSGSNGDPQMISRAVTDCCRNAVRVSM